ncbi:MAG TPA: hypothetical protein VFG52_11280 [Xanthomonadales bacterium]|nr:hypothetical protein [Xanthomonadales bacterium]
MPRQTLTPGVLSAAFMLVFLATASATADDEARNSSHQQFMTAFEPYCGQAFAAKVVHDSQPSEAWQKPLVVHIRDCEEGVIRMPLHVGEDRSRTWVLTLHDGFIDFQHIHLHEDGSPDTVSPYGGHTSDAGTATAQSFPADEASKNLFLANNLDVSVDNTWSISFPDSQTMVYQLTRPGRLFEVHVDLSQPIPLPPPAWGYQP